ncbi:hypothetical protein CTAYLR_002476 [Chrysophaeum taylorii]|uniref:glutathione gamma-glutamylcysteinyltransferase n=1 Tax=Chrysophaeum taylorii TaxID=2483200 RepID=A0AAD7UNG2_9STRA|nr:hypothetical protein CTAYLR_002476 [Chrysophaeum taylorii]
MLLFFFAAVVAGIRYEEFLLPAPSYAVELNSTEGWNLLTRQTTLSRSYQALSIHFETQVTESYCGIASAVAVFNSLPVPPVPVDPTYSPYAYWTQSVLGSDACVVGIHDPTYGSTRSQLAAMLGDCFPVKVLNVSATDSLADMRSIVFDALSDNATTHLVANFDRQGLNETGGGHFSPVAAYDPVGDLVLILDVAKYKYPPLWVPLADLVAAMDTVDPDSRAMRGLLVLAHKDNGAAAL